jgi:peroxiredoxin
MLEPAVDTPMKCSRSVTRAYSLAVSAYDPTVLPPGLPVPEDDGAAAHLPGTVVPSVSLVAADGDVVDVAELAQELTILYCYPRTGLPGHELSPLWDQTPGARGCTPQSLGFREAHVELTALGARVVGLSSQTVEEQHEFATRVGLPYAVLSDPELRLADALGLPTFEFAGVRLYKRIALVLEGGRVAHAFYPVFPPNENAAEVTRWLRDRPATA